MEFPAPGFRFWFSPGVAVGGIEKFNILGGFLDTRERRRITKVSLLYTSDFASGTTSKEKPTINQPQVLPTPQTSANNLKTDKSQPAFPISPVTSRTSKAVTAGRVVCAQDPRGPLQTSPRDDPKLLPETWTPPARRPKRALPDQRTPKSEPRGRLGRGGLSSRGRKGSPGCGSELHREPVPEAARR